MRDRIHAKRLTHSQWARIFILATLASGVLVAGCGGSSSGRSATTDGGATTSASSATQAGSAAPVSYGSGPLAFSRCMRANGVPDFPDPNPGGGFAFHAGSNGVISSPAFKAAQAKCGKYMPGGGGGPLSPGPPASAQTMSLLRKIAVCMRAHGVPQFPDPRASVAPGFNPTLGEYREITNYMGAILLYPASIDPQSPAYEQATRVCRAGFLAGNNAH